MAEPTPGPWRYITTPEEYEIQAEDGAPVAFVDDHYAPDEVRANGNLIAAAPDLRDALQRFLDLHGGLSSREYTKKWGVKDSTSYGNEFEVIVSLARAALAKAEGVQP